MVRIAFLLTCIGTATLCAGEVGVVTTDTPWRAFLVMGPQMDIAADKLRLANPRERGGYSTFDPAKAQDHSGLFSRMPPGTWQAADFDDSAWARYLSSDLNDYMGDYGLPSGWGGRTWPALLCLRTRFGIADPQQARDLKVSVTCLGGAVVYVNGQEVGRGYMPDGEVHPFTPAEKYPIAAYTMPGDAIPLPEIQWMVWKGKPEDAVLPRYEARVRRFTVSVPATALVKGANVLCVELHRAPVAGPMQRGGWMHLGVHQVTLTSASGAGAVAYADAAAGTRLWSAIPEEQVFDTATTQPVSRRNEGRMTCWMRGKLYRGIGSGNPLDPMHPIRMVAPRNGVGSGQAVLSNPAGLRGIRASLSAMKGPGGEIPASAVDIRYAAQHPAMHFCDALWPQPPDGARTVPVWVIVEVPRDQTPGWYTGTLTVQAASRDFPVPVQVLVSGATAPSSRDGDTLIGAASSPDTIALHYSVAPWSAEHFRLMEPSLKMLGQLGTDVLQVPVILGGMYGSSARGWLTRGSGGVRCAPLIRWVTDGDKVRPDFALLEKFVDAYLKHCPPPKALSLYVWDSGCANQVADAYENRRQDSRPQERKSPLLVQLWDPATGKTSDLPAPNFTDKDAAEFWKPLFEGVRQIVLKRGWSEKIIMASLGGDLRPSQREGELLREWAPYMRWHILSHFSGDPGPRDGRQLATGGLEVGVKGYPWRSFMEVFTAAKLEAILADQYLDLPTVRWHWKDDSPPLLFRTLPMTWGTVGHLGLDFWPGVKGAPRNTSFFTDSNAMTVPGPDGAVPTARYQMLREGVQDMDIRWAMIRAAMKLPPERKQAVYAVLDEFPRRAAWGSPYLSQCELSYDWRAYVAQVQTLAGELAGVASQAKWEQPPK